MHWLAEAMVVVAPVLVVGVCLRLIKSAGKVLDYITFEGMRKPYSSLPTADVGLLMVWMPWCLVVLVFAGPGGYV